MITPAVSEGSQSLSLKRLWEKGGTMMYVMALVISGADNTLVTVVNGPVALRRGGESPVTLVRFISYRVFAVFR